MSADLASVVQVRASALRSIHVAHDIRQPSLLDGYLLTAQARQTLARIVDGLGDRSPARAWTLTGPYGSGKSYFSLFLLHLLDATLPAHPQAVRQLEQVDLLLAERLRAALPADRPQGMLSVPIVGYRAPLAQVLLNGVRAALEPLRAHAPVAALLREAEQTSTTTSTAAFAAWIGRVCDALVQPPLSRSGLVLVVDELGKALEFAALHPESSDIYVLQELAERANRSGDAPLVLVGVLHQSFERYASGLSQAAQREWAKVQGRFEDIAFQEPPAQQIRFVASAIEHTAQLDPSLQAEVAQRARDAVAAGWLPLLLSADEFTALCLRAYPLHPAALVALPCLFRRLAQNERSLAAYLAAHEPFGLQELLQARKVGEWVELADLFDYLVANFHTRLYASLRARPLTETLERLGSAEGLDPLAVRVLKTIGLLHWLGEVSPLRATEDRVLAALRSAECTDEAIRRALGALRARSYVVYRKFSHSYAVWQGSDVDLEQQLEKGRQQTAGAFSLAEVLQRYLPPRPLIAHRHSYQSGVVRAFQVRYVDARALPASPPRPEGSAVGLVTICLPASHAERQEALAWAQQPSLAQLPNLIVGVAAPNAQLVELVGELRALRWVREHTPELRDDPVARRELRARQATVEHLIHSELERLTLFKPRDLGEAGAWFWRGKPVTEARSLSGLLSAVCDALYPQSPRIWNELINRQALSSQGAAARRALIEAMLTRADQPGLGIAGYPPERSMYESLLSAGGLHRAGAQGKWGFAPPPIDDPLRLQPAWQAIADVVFAEPPTPREVQALFEVLSAPPYGVTAGVAPVLLCAFWLAHRDEVTLYREGTLLPEPSVADWEVLLRKPELFAVAGCRVTGLRAAVVERMARGLGVAPQVLPVVRAVIGRLRALPEHAWRTRRLPEPALALRRAVEAARSPERLLFVELPQALGVPPLDGRAFDEAAFDVFFQRLNTALEALGGALPRLVAWARDTWLEACGLPVGAEGWAQFRALAAQLAPRTAQPALLPLLRRAVEAADDRAALESVLALLGDRPVRTWGDADADRFSAQAQHFGRLFRAELAADPASTLSPAQRAASQRLAEQMRAYLSALAVDPQVLRAALREILSGLEDQGLQ
ncbi:MAG: hypothetical protein RML84_11115 [Anaerolineae bacterium]|nr:hypothetical protein [Anaerolineae bacterium]